MRFCAQDTKVFVCHEVFARLFQKAARADGGVGRAPQSAKSHNGAFLLRLLLQKKKRELTHMRSMCVGVAETGVGIYLLFWLLAGL